MRPSVSALCSRQAPPTRRRRTAGAVLVVALAVCLTAGTAQARAAERTTNSGVIAVCGAFDREVDALRAALGFRDNPSVEVTTIGGVKFERGRVEGRDVVLFTTGRNLINAAFRTQITLDHFHVDFLLFAGIAGGVDPSLHVGDIVVPAQWANHSIAAMFNEDGKGGYVTGRYPVDSANKNFGLIFPTPTHVDDGSGERPIFFVPVDKRMLSSATATVAKFARPAFNGREIEVRIGGTGVSGTVFVDSAKYRGWLYENFAATCVDMESVAVAQACWANHTPALIVRTLSDLAGAEPGPNGIRRNQNKVLEACARFLRQLLVELPGAKEERSVEAHPAEP